MTSAQHHAWKKAGKPVSGLIRPLAKLRDRLRDHGYVVFDIGDKSHLDHQPPEDHTPYSETGWPGDSPKWWLHAIDIMPPRPGSGLPSLQQLGAQLFADKQANDPGMAWAKYMNWGPDSDEDAVKDSWRPHHKRSTSTDTGHVHLSGRTDMTHYAGADDYDPVARIRHTKLPVHTPPLEADVIYTVTQVPNGSKDCVGALVVNNSRCLATLAGPFSLNGTEAASLPITYWPAASVTTTWARLQQLCSLLKPAPTPFNDAQVSLIVEKVTAALAVKADHAAIVADVKRALADGIG